MSLGIECQLEPLDILVITGMQYVTVDNGVYHKPLRVVGQMQYIFGRSGMSYFECLLVSVLKSTKTVVMLFYALLLKFFIPPCVI